MMVLLWLILFSSPIQAHDLTQVPAGCLKQVGICSVRFPVKGQFGLRDMLISASAGTTMTINNDTIELLDGEIWSPHWPQLTLQHGLLNVRMKGDVLIRKTGDLLTIYNLDGEAEVRGPGKVTETLVAGLQNWYRGVGQGGHWVQGVMQPLRTEDLKQDLRVLAPASVIEIQNKISVYRQNRAQAVEDSAELYRGVAQFREIASENLEKLRQERLRAQAKERAGFKKMFHDRLYHPQDSSLN